MNPPPPGEPERPRWPPPDYASPPPQHQINVKQTQWGLGGLWFWVGAILFMVVSCGGCLALCALGGLFSPDTASP